DFLEQIDSRVRDALGGGLGDADRWQGFTLKAIDGSSSKLADTEENQEAFPQPSGQKPGCGFPVMGFAGLLNLGHGGWEAIATGPQTAHDLTLAAELTAFLSEDDLLLADRAYCSYAFIAAVRARGAHCVMRLH
ncbi:transposase, partial [Haloferula sp. A504]|uniref:transposase n=1 Tax=Haloferula sp. A504 TaxID=3373601 RepID=UPI0031C36D12|nr:transposase [Verrucomicrobiaceae bacterium E54]